MFSMSSDVMRKAPTDALPLAHSNLDLSPAESAIPPDRHCGASGRWSGALNPFSPSAPRNRLPCHIYPEPAWPSSLNNTLSHRGAHSRPHVNETHHLSRLKRPYNSTDLPTLKRNTCRSFAVVMLQVEMVLFVCLVLWMCVFSQEPSSKVVADRYAVFWNRTNAK
eukprot:superscaffoldBa00000574_g5743